MPALRGFKTPRERATTPNQTNLMKTNRKKARQFPMNGPNLTIQRLMEEPRKNRSILRHYFKTSNQVTRPETVAVASLK